MILHFQPCPLKLLSLGFIPAVSPSTPWREPAQKLPGFDCCHLMRRRSCYARATKGRRPQQQLPKPAIPIFFLLLHVPLRDQLSLHERRRIRSGSGLGEKGCQKMLPNLLRNHQDNYSWVISLRTVKCRL
ncbi:hypothetical protein BaRGS_00032808 [Batillaria attramentaria]|uniref:Uncharacterized protein n=1 Tax=Batillaria attramentaria TaxID=370345 RepID=A0ABD0JM62_9CAEN